MQIELKLEQDAELSQLYKDSVQKFIDRWGIGLYERAEKAEPGLLAQIDQAQERLNQVWLKARKDKAILPEFKKALQEWEILHLKALKMTEIKLLVD